MARIFVIDSFIFLAAAAGDGGCPVHDASADSSGCRAHDAADLLQLRRQQRRVQGPSPPPVARSVELRARTAGWLDGHQHFGAGANWMGQVMCLPDAQVRMQELFDLSVWKAGVRSASRKEGFVAYRPINEGMGMDDLMLYSIFSRERIGELDMSVIDTPGFAEAVEATRVDLEDLAATYIVGPGLNKSVTTESWNDRASKQSSGTFYPLVLCLEDVQNMSNSSVAKPILRRHLLRTVLSSSPLHDFDSGYIGRKMLYSNNLTLQARYEVQEAIDANIVDSSIFSVGDYPGNDETKRAAFYSATGNASIKSRWYSAALGCSFAQGANGTRLQEWNETMGRIIVTEKNSSEYGCYNNVDKVMEQFFEPGIIGMDSLAPEQFIFSRDKAGREPLISAARAMLRAAKQKRQRMVMHVHVGEGSPTYDYGAYLVEGAKKPMSPLSASDAEGLSKLKAERFGMQEDKFLGLCAAAKEEALLEPEFLPLHRVTDLGAASCPGAWPLRSPADKAASAAGETRCRPGEPGHYEAARMNIDTFLDIIEHDVLPLAEFHDLHRYVMIRAGHATHAAPAQARRMQSLGISVDLNLGSNIMTGSIYVETAAARAAFGRKPGILNSNQWEDNLDMHADPEELVYEFRSHSVLPLLLAGASFLLGTDGTGVEKSGLAGACDAIHIMLAYYNEKGPVPVASFRGRGRPKSLLAHRWVNQLYSEFGHYKGEACVDGLQNSRAFADWLDAAP